MNILKSSKNLLIKHDSSDLISIMIEKGEKTLRMESTLLMEDEIRNFLDNISKALTLMYFWIVMVKIIIFV